MKYFNQIRGLLYVSHHRKLRIQSIAQHLNESEYNIVFLQEVSNSILNNLI